MPDIEVRELKKDEYKIWDELVESSPHGTIFHSSSWLTIHSELLNKKLKIYGCFENEELVGGCSLYTYKLKSFFRVASSTIEMTPYGGVVLAQSPSSKVRKQEQTHRDILKSLCNVFDNEHFDHIQLVGSPGFVDIRPFTWNGWDSKIHYAYYLILNDFEKRLSRNLKRNINKAIKNEISIEKSQDIDSFYELFEETFLHQGLKPPVTKGFFLNVFRMILKQKKGDMWIAKTKSNEIAAADIFVYDDKRAYRWSATTHTKLRRTGANFLLLSVELQDLRSRGFKEVNLMAANMPQLAEFTTNFNPILVPYYSVEKKTVLLKIAEIIYKKVKKMKNDFIYYIRVLHSSVGCYRRLLQDYMGSFLVKNWKKVDSEDIVSVNSEMLKDIFCIYNDNFDVDSTKMIMRYSKIFRDIFYIAKSENDIAGYCIYYIKPVFSLKKIKKTSVIYSIAVNKKYRQKGLGKRLLEHSIAEMKLNDICSICLYVNRENLPAIDLYKLKGFKIVEKVKDICGEGKECYKMELGLME